MSQLIGIYSPEIPQGRTKLKWSWTKLRFEKFIEVSMTLVGCREEQVEIFLAEKDYNELIRQTASGWKVEIIFDPDMPKGGQLCSLNPISPYNAQHALIFGRSIS
jgi:hypothetical protein